MKSKLLQIKTEVADARGLTAQLKAPLLFKGIDRMDGRRDRRQRYDVSPDLIVG